MNALEEADFPHSDFGDSENILVLSPDSSSKTDEACASLLQPSSPHRQTVLSLTLDQSPDHRIAQWRKHAQHTNWATVGFIPIGDLARSSVTTGQTTSEKGIKYDIKPVGHPGDLTDIGIQITNFLTDWEVDDTQLVVCVHSLTELLRHVSLRKTYQFLNVLTHQLKAAGAVSHYHLDPTDHDERTLNLMKSVFDTVIQSTDSAEWEFAQQ